MGGLENISGLVVEVDRNGSDCSALSLYNDLAIRHAD